MFMLVLFTPDIADFTLSGRLVVPSILCNEAETGLLSLRLTDSPLRASPWPLLTRTPDWLPAERAIGRVTSFHVTRSTRLNLSHQISADKTNVGYLSHYKLKALSREYRWSNSPPPPDRLVRLDFLVSIRGRLPFPPLACCP